VFWPFSLTLIHSSAWRNGLIIPEEAHRGPPRKPKTLKIEIRTEHAESVYKDSLCCRILHVRGGCYSLPRILHLYPTSRTLAALSGSERTMKGNPVVMIDVDRHGARGQLTRFGLHLLHVGIGTCSVVR